MHFKEGKLIQLLSEIDESELKSLMKFVKSPYHNTNKLIIPLLQKIIAYHPDFDHKKLTKEHLYHFIHSEGKPYHEGRMNLLMTNLVSVIQDFYMYQEFQKDKILQRRLKGKAYSNRNLYKNYKKEVEVVLDDLEKSPFREEEYFFQRYDAEQKLFFHIETPKNHDGAIYLQNAMENLDLFYMTAKLNLASEQITMTKRLNISKEIIFLNPILSHLEIRKNQPNVLGIYYKIIKLRIEENSINYYYEIKEKLSSCLNSIKLLSQKLIYFNLVNYGIGLLNQGDKDILKELLILYKFGISQNFIINNNTISPSTYSNISLISTNSGEFEWSLNFILEYEGYLPKGEIYFTKLMALAFLNYRKGFAEDDNHFSKTLELLREITYSKKNIFLFLRSRLLWIRTSFEILKDDRSYHLTLLDYIKSFESQLKKDNVLSPERVQRYFSFILYVKKIIKLLMKNNRSKEEVDKVLSEIENQSNIALKNWFIEKLEEFH
ncbi:MAG: hypothetical protein AB8H03_10125 [Saprospiraceae bacterium]